MPTVDDFELLDDWRLLPSAEDTCGVELLGGMPGGHDSPPGACGGGDDLQLQSSRGQPLHSQCFCLVSCSGSSSASTTTLGNLGKDIGLGKTTSDGVPAVGPNQ